MLEGPHQGRHLVGQRDGGSKGPPSGSPSKAEKPLRASAMVAKPGCCA